MEKDTNIRLLAFVTGESITPYKIKKVLSQSTEVSLTNQNALYGYLKDNGYRNIDSVLEDGKTALTEKVHDGDFAILTDDMKVETFDDGNRRGYMIDTAIDIDFENFIGLTHEKEEDYIR